MGSRWHDKIGWGEEGIAAMMVAAMSLRRRWAADDATRSDGEACPEPFAGKGDE